MINLSKTITLLKKSYRDVDFIVFFFTFSVNMETFLKSAAVDVPNLVGLKFSDNDLVDMIGCVHVEAPHRDEKRYNILFGCDSV